MVTSLKICLITTIQLSRLEEKSLNKFVLMTGILMKLDYWKGMTWMQKKEKKYTKKDKKVIKEKFRIGYILKSADIRTQVSSRYSENSSHSYLCTSRHPHAQLCTPIHTLTHPHTPMHIPTHTCSWPELDKPHEITCK